MSQPRGRNLRLSVPRRFVGDLVHFARKVPTVPVQRHMDVSAVAAERHAATPRPGWCAIFTKAYACVAAETPELRRAYMAFPWPHLYEHPVSVASVAVERQYEGEDAVFFVQVREPEARTLAEIDQKLREGKEAPIASVGSFRRAVRISRLPRPLRRALWWFGLNVKGRKRASYMGTFGVSVYAALGAASLHPLSPLTTAMNYGVIDPAGGIDVRIIYDHRVMDGTTVARALARMEEVLNGQILDELRGLRGAAAA
jgi:hypothetical protein